MSLGVASLSKWLSGPYIASSGGLRGGTHVESPHREVPEQERLVLYVPPALQQRPARLHQHVLHARGGVRGGRLEGGLQSPLRPGAAQAPARAARGAPAPPVARGPGQGVERAGREATEAGAAAGGMSLDLAADGDMSREQLRTPSWPTWRSSAGAKGGAEVSARPQTEHRGGGASVGDGPAAAGAGRHHVPLVASPENRRWL